jgi:hypothetical protein
MKHLLIIVGAFILIFGIAVLNIRLFSGPEDTWICQNGAWVMHGRPYASAPSTGCVSKMASQSMKNISVVPAQPAAISADQVRAEIKIDQPVSNTIVSSPVTVEGQAKGSWFFEASFPIKRIGEDGETIGQGIATAQSDWMTPGFVPFKASIEFDPGSSTIGMIILRNDNPSGLPENEKQYGIPVRFSKVEKITLKAYFGNTDLNPAAMDCSLVFPVERLVNKTKSTARAALEELLSGPTDAEKTQGYFTSLNPGVKINSLTITNGTAKVDFDQQMDFQMGGSCRVAAIRSQITQTLKQFPSVKEVIISVAGNNAEALQP